MAMPENIRENVANFQDKVLHIRKKAGDGGPPAKFLRESERKVRLFVVGSRKQIRKSKRDENFLERRLEVQFWRAYEHLLNGDESIEDIKYAVTRASKYLPMLSDSELHARLTHIREGRYNNGDVLAVSNHYLLQGNLEGCHTIRRFFYEEKQPQNSALPPSSALDAVDLAIQNGFGTSTGDLS